MPIGGYQPAQKWLKDRKGRVLTVVDIQHYQRIVVALEKTAEEPEWARERAAFGVEFMKTDFRLSNQADKLAVLYNGLLRSGSKTGH